MDETAANEAGGMVVTQVNGRLRIDQADDRIRVSTALMDELRAGHGHPDVSLSGDAIGVEAVNGRFAYQITGKDPGGRCYLAERVEVPSLGAWWAEAAAQVEWPG
jgi:hypothetical protein